MAYTAILTRPTGMPESAPPVRCRRPRTRSGRSACVQHDRGRAPQHQEHQCRDRDGVAEQPLAEHAEGRRRQARTLAVRDVDVLVVRRDQRQSARRLQPGQGHDERLQPEAAWKSAPWTVPNSVPARARASSVGRRPQPGDTATPSARCQAQHRADREVDPAAMITNVMPSAMMPVSETADDVGELSGGGTGSRRAAAARR